MAAIQRPDPVGYTAAIIDRLAAANREKAAQKAIIDQAEQRFAAAANEAAKAFRELHDELTRMDVASSGNCGWEQRVARFLVELRTHGVRAFAAPRLLTDDEVAECDERYYFRSARVIQRKFCEANGLPPPEKHVGGVAACECTRPMVPVGRTCIKCGGIAAGVRVDAPPDRAAVLQEAKTAIDRYIRPGRLAGDGFDKTAERNGLILASNILAEMLAGAAGVQEVPRG